MSSGEKKEPKDERTSLSYISWHMKELIAEMKTLNMHLANITASLSTSKAIRPTSVKELTDDVPF